MVEALEMELDTGGGARGDGGCGGEFGGFFWGGVGGGIGGGYHELS